MYIIRIVYIMKIGTVIMGPILYGLMDHPYCSAVNIIIHVFTIILVSHAFLSSHIGFVN